MDSKELRYCIAVSIINGIGPVNARKMIAAFGGLEAVFSEGPKHLAKWKVHPEVIKQLRDPYLLDLADKELEFIDSNGIHALSVLDANYPLRLKGCYDAPLVLYVKGQNNLNNGKFLGIVGTRLATNYGKKICEELIRGFNNTDLTIVSGLAYGIDTRAHQAALQFNLPTYAVLAHGLHRLYPDSNKNLASTMQKQGGIITEFPSTASFVPGNFPSRNRIIAGLCDAVVVIESGLKGGSLITAEIAGSYNRDVFAIPGNVGATKSEGCNWLIKNNKGVLIESAQDIIYQMNWEQSSSQKMMQRNLFEVLTDKEKQIVDLLRNAGTMRIDEISHKSGQSINNSASVLLALEFKNVIKSLPGKIYTLID